MRPNGIMLARNIIVLLFFIMKWLSSNIKTKTNFTASSRQEKKTLNVNKEISPYYNVYPLNHVFPDLYIVHFQIYQESDTLDMCITRIKYLQEKNPIRIKLPSFIEISQNKTKNMNSDTVHRKIDDMDTKAR
jgi:hypothetical protein